MAFPLDRGTLLEKLRCSTCETAVRELLEFLDGWASNGAAAACHPEEYKHDPPELAAQMRRAWGLEMAFKELLNQNLDIAGSLLSACMSATIAATVAAGRATVLSPAGMVAPNETRH